MKKVIAVALLCVLAAVCTASFSACFVHEHTIVSVAAEEPTCTESGCVAHYECSACGELFADAEGTVALGADEVTLAPTGHAFVGVSSDESAHTVRCETCGAVQTGPHAYTRVSGRNVGHVYREECVCGRHTYEKIPTVSINTDGGVEIEGNKDNAEYYDCTVSVSGCDEEYKLADAVGRVKVRGNYSANYEKKPYKIKFDDKQVMLGVNDGLKAKEWVLLADYKDRSLLRNPTVHYLASEMLGEDGYYSTDSRYVNVFVNGDDRGLYLLAEQQEVREERVNVAEPEDPEDYEEGSAEYEAALENVHTGYFVELDAYADSEVALERFYINYEGGGKYADGSDIPTGKFMKKYAIKSDVYSEAQNSFIAKCIQNIYAVLADAVYGDHSDIAADPFMRIDEDGNKVGDTTLKSVRDAVEATIELDSLVDTFILNEICMDMDVGWSSFLMSLDMSESGSGKLVFQAPWDWDSSLGFDVDETDGIYTCMPYTGNSNSATPKDYVNPWLTLLSSEQWFRDEVALRYAELKDRGVFENSISRLYEIASVYETEINHNFSVWKNCLTFTDGCNSAYAACTTHETATEYLADFLETRYAFLDTAFVVGGDWT